MEEDGTPHTTNLCRKCNNLKLTESGETKVTNAVWQAMLEQKVSRGRLSAAFGTDGFEEGMWKRFTVKKLWATKSLEAAAKPVQLETSSSWQNGSSCREELEVLRVTGDMRLDGTMMRQVI